MICIYIYIHILFKVTIEVHTPLIILFKFHSEHPWNADFWTPMENSCCFPPENAGNMCPPSPCSTRHYWHLAPGRRSTFTPSMNRNPDFHRSTFKSLTVKYVKNTGGIRINIKKVPLSHRIHVWHIC